MAGFNSTYGSKVLDAILNGDQSISSATLYLGLWTATLNGSSTGSTAGETSYSTYSRQTMSANTTVWPVASSGVISNGTTITFPEAGDSGGTVTHWALIDASSAGNIVFYGALGSSIVIGSGDIPAVMVGDLIITLT